MNVKAEVGGPCLYPQSEQLMPSSDCVYTVLNCTGVTHRSLRNKEISLKMTI